LGVFALGTLCIDSASAEDPHEHTGKIMDNLTLRPVAASVAFTVSGDSYPARYKRICSVINNKVAHLLLESPMTQPPRGFDLSIGTSVGGFDDGIDPERPGCALEALVLAYNLNERGAVVRDGEGPAAKVAINTPLAISERFFLTGDAKDERDSEDVYIRSPKRFYLEPKPDGEISGYPRYGDWMVITRRQAPPLMLPATRGEYLTWQNDWLSRQIAGDEKERQKLQAFAAAAHIKDESSAEINKVIADLKSARDQINAALSGLSPAERSAPAWCRKNSGTGAASALLAMQYVDAPAKSAGAQPLFVPNRNFIDSKQEDQPQLMLINLAALQGAEDAEKANSVSSQKVLKQLEQSWVQLLPKFNALVNP
jgi:hypothetical protein